MVNLTIRNISKRLINFGTRKGRMLCINQENEMTLDSELSELFSDIIANYVEGGFIEIVSKKASIKVEEKPEEKPNRNKTNSKIRHTLRD